MRILQHLIIARLLCLQNYNVRQIRGVLELVIKSRLLVTHVPDLIKRSKETFCSIKCNLTTVTRGINLYLQVLMYSLIKPYQQRYDTTRLSRCRNCIVYVLPYGWSFIGLVAIRCISKNENSPNLTKRRMFQNCFKQTCVTQFVYLFFLVITKTVFYENCS